MNFIRMYVSVIIFQNSHVLTTICTQNLFPSFAILLLTRSIVYLSPAIITMADNVQLICAYESLHSALYYIFCEGEVRKILLMFKKFQDTMSFEYLLCRNTIHDIIYVLHINH